jgi:class 3 adenylate cyclase
VRPPGDGSSLTASARIAEARRNASSPPGRQTRQEARAPRPGRGTRWSSTATICSVGTRSGVVALLFTDLVGSTEMLDRLGDDAAEELRRVHFSLLRAAVADPEGQEIKSLGDGLRVSFASPVQAVGCAVAMQRAIATHNRDHADQELRVRIGLHAGDPVREEDDLFGTAVVVARRLCDRAEGGQILASELLAALVGSRGGFRFRPVGRLPLKGLTRLGRAGASEFRTVLLLADPGVGNPPGQRAPGPSRRRGPGPRRPGPPARRDDVVRAVGRGAGRPPSGPGAGRGG